MTATLTIDATALSDTSLDWPSFLAASFAGLASGDTTFYGGSPDSAFGGTYYMNGSQVAARYAEGGGTGGVPAAATVILEGEDLAYDFIHHGAQFGHGITGELDGLTFGSWIEGTTTATEGTGSAGRVAGLATGVVIDGFDLAAAPGAGTDPATNRVYAVYAAVRDGDAAALAEIIASYAVEMIGSAGNDRLDGYAFDDTLFGGRGDDSLRASRGDDVMLGGRGADTIRGGSGSDILLGGTGADDLAGGIGRDILRGGTGADRLSGGAGNDRLTGDAGADSFVILASAGREVVTDLEIGIDRIDVSALGLTALADFAIDSSRPGATDLTAGGVTLRLLGIDAADLSDAIFLF